VATLPGTDVLPRGESECVYGKWGNHGRAFRDAERLVMNRLAAALVWLFCLSTVTTVFIVVNPSHYEGNLGKIATVLQGLVAGTALGIAIVWVYGLTPLARRYHWHTGHHAVNFGGTVGHYLESRHWHKALNLRCELVDPQGVTWGPVPVHWPGKPWYLGPGDRCQEVTLGWFKVTKTLPGTYRFVWLIDAEERDTPITIAVEKWRAFPIPRFPRLRHPIRYLRRLAAERRHRVQG